MDFPKLRQVNLFPVEMDGKSLICLQDPLNLNEKALFLPPALALMVSLFDGRHSILDIQTEYMRRFGELVYTDVIQRIVTQLEENLFLEGDRFQEAVREMEEGFLRASVREAAFAGKSYERDPAELRLRIESYFSHPEGPGLPEGKKDGNPLKGAVAPHIDFQRGGVGYAFAHREIWERTAPDCFVILGTSHSWTKYPFVLSRKDFITPFGKLETDRELVDAIQSRCSYDLFADEPVQRIEHSVEFQCVFLRHLNPQPLPLRIIPILCGSLHEAVSKRVSPMELKEVRELIEGMSDAVASLRRNVCYLASADLAHMGLQFGDPEGIGEYQLRTLEEEDREMLGHVERVDPERFFSSVAEEQDRRRICGLGAIYTLLHLLHGGEGSLLKYGQAFTRETQSVVSFASLVFG